MQPRIMQWGSERWASGRDLVLLFHKLFAGGFDRYGETEFGSVLLSILVAGLFLTSRL
jgi:hypothetical protein